MASKKDSHPASSPSSGPVTVLVLYKLKPGTESKFKPLLANHWPTLDRCGLVTKEKPKIWRAVNARSPDKIAYAEIMSWKDGSSSDTAHQTPEVMKIWEPMGPILENLEIMHIEPANL